LIDNLSKLRSDLYSDLLQLRVLNRLHGSKRVYGGNFDFAVALFPNNHIAGQHRADSGLYLQGLVGKWRIAGTKDGVFAEINV
jgi:hypothetical protein